MADSVMKVDTGMAITTNRIKGAGTEPKYIGWGTGTTAPAHDNTALETAAAEARADGTTTQQTTNTTNDTYQVVGTLVCAGSGKTITEVATFDASANGNMDVRATFTGIALSVGDGIIFTIKQVFDQA
jgi:hypothetical protein